MKYLRLSEKNESDFEGKRADDQDYDLLINEDTEVRKPDGSLLCVVLKKSISPKATARAWEVLKKENLSSRNRGTAAGTDYQGKILKRDGTYSNTVQTLESIQSGIIGFFERTARFPYCRACSWNLNNPEKWSALLPMVKEVDSLFKKHAKDRYENQAKFAAKAHKDFIIPGTHFSTLTVNKNFRTAYHKDAGNLPDGISCMTVIRQGKWSGANLVFPQYRVAAQLDTFDTIIFDPHEIHGNTPLIKLSEDAVRCSIVYYFREKIQFCESAEKELLRVKNRKQGEQLFKSLLRSKNK